ncbi:MAG: CDP-alcohol phosphatidyltransferase family protein [Burkholderiales bacterium]|nr:MAG: CDP-alcohol phosphatidyltransferase family protein [Burkholderiales bacterium]TAG77614.1 MAG: CDP-alcohol phosphatidyltransferase family protein [Betaproteobacteria bacterium]
MLDRYALPLLSRPHRAVARAARAAGLSADTVTVLGCAIGLVGAALIVTECYGWALLLFCVNRFLDGVDGAMARQVGPTPRGGFLDIACDYFVYAAYPLAFAVANPVANALASATLLASFIGTASTFLAFAAIHAKAGGEANPVYPNKAIHYLGGLTEGTETIVAFCAMCLWPQYFAMIAYMFAAACFVTMLTRLWTGARALTSE